MKSFVFGSIVTALIISMAFNALQYSGYLKSPYAWVVADADGVNYSGVDMKNPDAILAAADAYGREQRGRK